MHHIRTRQMNRRGETVGTVVIEDMNASVPLDHGDYSSFNSHGTNGDEEEEEEEDDVDEVVADSSVVDDDSHHRRALEQPLFSKHALSFDEIEKLLLAPNQIPITKVCRSVPSAYNFGNGTFVVDLRSLADPQDLGRDNMGSWGTPSTRSRYYTRDPAGKFERVDREGKLPRGMSYDVKIIRTWARNPSSNLKLARCLYRCLDPEGTASPLAFLTYQWRGKPFSFTPRPHGNSKKEDAIPFISRKRSEIAVMGYSRKRRASPSLHMRSPSPLADSPSPARPLRRQKIPVAADFDPDSDRIGTTTYPGEMFDYHAHRQKLEVEKLRMEIDVLKWQRSCFQMRYNILRMQEEQVAQGAIVHIQDEGAVTEESLIRHVQIP